MSMDQTEPESEPRRKGGPFKFFEEVRSEGRKVTWATRQEVTVSTILVIIFGITAAVFFFIVDTLLRTFMQFVLSLSLGG
jgi:preprotein translocase subunit SecE